LFGKSLVEETGKGIPIKEIEGLRKEGGRERDAGMEERKGGS